jgi:glycosyltransferase involved in cell wall biosynthesis
MRLALVSQEYPPETAKGGLGSQTYLKAHGLASLGFEVHVISRSLTGQRIERLDHGVHVLRIPGVDQRLPLHTEMADWLTYSAEVAAAVNDLHRSRPLDLVEFPEWGAEAYVHLLNRTQWNRIPTAIQLHGPLVMFAHILHWPEVSSEFYRVGTHMEGTCLRLADAVFSSSACSADWCARQYGLSRSVIPILHTGVDTNLFAPRPGPKAKRPTIVFVGKLAANKGVHQLVQAAGQLVGEFPDLQLRLLGRGDDQVVREIKAMASKGGPPDLVDLAGFVDRSELPHHLSRAHIFAAPSLYEGGPGFAWLEAMACGLPVIACAGSGVAEVVRHGETGFLVAPRDLAALTDALRTLLRNGDKRQEMGEKARDFVLTEADSRNCFKRLETFYTTVAAGQPVSTS